MPGLPFGEQAGLPTDIQSLMQQGGLPPTFQAMMQQSMPLAAAQAVGAQGVGPLAAGPQAVGVQGAGPLAAGAQAVGVQGAGPLAAAVPPVAAAHGAVPQSAASQAATARPTSIQVPGGFGPIIQEAAHKYGVDPALIAAVMETESKFNPDAVSQAGAKGLMQLMPATARGLGVTDAKDPRQAILGGAKLLGILSDKYKGDLKLTLAAYNAGSGAVDKHGGIPPYGETQKYVPLVMSAYERFKTQFGNPTQATPATSVSRPGTGR
jgi:soluble lytic murein transglycosylase-like protein